MPEEPTSPNDALRAAMAAGRWDAAIALLRQGADPLTLDAEDVPLVLAASESGEPALLAAFLDAGAPVDTTDPMIGWTPLMTATSEGDLALVQLLLARGADPNHRETSDLEGGHTVLTVAVGEDPSLPVIEALLRAGADPSLPRADGWTPLMHAAYEGNPQLLRLLLDAGADAGAVKPDGETALAVARRRERLDAVAVLSGGPDPVEAARERIAALWERLDRWMAEHAPPCHEAIGRARGASPDAIAALEAAVGAPVPADLRAYWLRYGGDDGMPWREYEGLGVDHALADWRTSSELTAAGTFADAEPHEIEDGERIRYTWWDAGWIPFARDGGGNLYCVDVAPGPAGHWGQVIAWEVHGGPAGPLATSLESFLRAYVAEIESGRLVYEPDSGTFDRTS